MKKALALGLLLMAVWLFAAALGETDGDFSFTASGTYASISGYTGAGGDVTVPDTVSAGGVDYTVNAIASRAFENHAELTRVTLPNSVTSLGTYAFSGCTGLQEINLSSGLAAISGNAFNGCAALQAVEVPSGVTSIGGRAFMGCAALEAVSLPDSLTTIATGAFSGTALEVLNLPADVDTVGANAFPAGILLMIRGSNTMAGDTVTGTYDFCEYSSRTGGVGINRFVVTGEAATVPAAIEGLPVVAIAGDVFSGSASLKTVTVAADLLSLPGYAFASVPTLQEIFLPENITSIGNEAIPSGCMVHCAYDSDTSYMLSDNNIVFYKPGDTIFGCRYIDNLLYLVQYNGEDDVIEVPEGIEGVAYVFGVYNKMTAVVFPQSLKVIGYEAFKNCSGLTSITIPDTIDTIGYQAFAGSALRSITLPDNVRVVGNGAFRDCTNLASVTFRVANGVGVTSIGNEAFYNTGLRSVTIPATAMTIGSNAFAQSTRLATVNLPANGALERIGSYAFSGTPIASLTVPGTVKTIDDYAFASCDSLASATLSQGVETIGNGVFSNDTALRTVDIPDGVTSIGSEAFNYCSALHSVALPNSVASLGESAFSYTGLSGGVTLSTALTALPQNAFYESQLTRIDIPVGITSIGASAFEHSGLQAIAFDSGSALRTIGADAFKNCYQLTGIELPDGMTTLSSCFTGCRKAIVGLPDSIKYISGIAFRDVRAVVGSRNNDILKSLDRFGFDDERTWIYSYINDEGVEDYDTLRIVDYIGTATAENLPDDVVVLGANALANHSLKRVNVSAASALAEIKSGGMGDVLAVCDPLCGYDTLKLFSRFIYPDEPDFVYAYYDDDGSLSTDLYVKAYIGAASAATLSERADCIGNSAFADCAGLRSITLPDTGIKAIGTNAFHAALGPVCTVGSDTHSLLVAGGYCVEVAGYPGLFAVQRDGALYNAFYAGSERLVDLPDNIASTTAEYTDAYEEYHWKPEEYDPVTGEIIIPGDEWYEQGYAHHPATFPETTIYRTRFDTQTSNTLSDNGYRITVAGLEDFGFRKNHHPEIVDMSSTGRDDPYYEYRTTANAYSGDAWFMDRYYGSETDLVLPEAIPYVCLDALSGLNSLKASNTISAISYEVVNPLPPQGGLKLILPNAEAAQRVIRCDAMNLHSLELQFQVEGMPELTLGGAVLPGYDSFDVSHAELQLLEYTGGQSVYEVTRETPFKLVAEGAFGSTVYYMKGYPDVTVRYGIYQGYDGMNQAGLIITGYTGAGEELVLESDMCADAIDASALPAGLRLMMDATLADRFPDVSFHPLDCPELVCKFDPYMGMIMITGCDISTGELTIPDGALEYVDGIQQGALPDGVKVFMNLNHRLASKFTNRNFCPIGAPEFEYRFFEDSRGSTLVRYTGSDSEVTLPPVFTPIAGDALPATVTSVNLDRIAGYVDVSYWPDRMTGGSIRLCAALDSDFVDYYRQNSISFYTLLHLRDCPDITYYIESGRTILSDYTGDADAITLPGGFDSLGAGTEECFNGRIVYTEAGSSTEQILTSQGVHCFSEPIKVTTLPANLTEIGEESFEGAALEEIVIPSGCTHIYSRAFANCSRLAVVHIPDDLEWISSDAFDGCIGILFSVKQGSAGESALANVSVYRSRVKYE